MKRLHACLRVVDFFPVPLLMAQDSRTVVEPVMPTICTPPDAQLNTSGRSLEEADEDKLDSARIQRALDACGNGQGVVLRTEGGANAFLSGALELHARAR